MISSGIIASLIQKKATIVIQKGIVYQQTMMSARGARGAATLRSTKLAWPVIHRVARDHFLSHGNSLIGLKPRHAHQMQAATNAIRFLSKLNSAGWKPSSAITLNDAVIATVVIAATFMAMTATSLLSLLLGNSGSTGPKESSLTTESFI